ncbi:bifunctional hydroxymethylpyrimidine kinase/phosphomethylpyrimidine kinase [Brevibacterium senegalense]|uniref:bifunctional hydroxymethylpyrimidine kinase/phosphomethylpyrimidine kinase n=1 Tax=Brevibacterium senegalense TaxID=1033736 RepID=UPI0002F42553|nr:hydroxymethylpyrimidine/phosphomethylpyrimidine kinase [Brevibacterium senegalense]
MTDSPGTTVSPVPRILTIAGSDVSGGAGLEADLKMFTEYGAFGTAVVTCIVTFDPAQSFEHDITFIDTDAIIKQLDSTLAVHDFAVIKSGMLGSVDSALALAASLRENHLPYVFDPVLVCKGSGTMVDLKDLFVENLVPLATVITPNLEEAATLTGRGPIQSVDGMVEAARDIRAMGAQHVVVKGGARLAGPDAIDVLLEAAPDGDRITVFSAPKAHDRMVNGAGCSFASAIAAGLATGADVTEAVRLAKLRVAHGIAASLTNATGVDSLFHPAARVRPQEGLSVTVEPRD